MHSQPDHLSSKSSLVQAILIALVLCTAFLVVRMAFDMSNKDLSLIGNENQRILKANKTLIEEHTKLLRANTDKINRIMDYVKRADAAKAQ